MKKSIKLLIVIVMIMVLSIPNCIVASASNMENHNKTREKAIQKNEKYIESNINSLLKNAKQSRVYTGKKAKLEDNNGNVYEVSLYDIDEEKLYDDNGNSLNISAQTYAYDFSDATIKSIGTGNTYKEMWDSTYSVKGYITIYYTYDLVNNTYAYILTQVSGGYIISDGSVSIASQSLVYGEGGYSASNGLVNLHNTQTPTSSSWNYLTGYNTNCVLAGNYTFGATYTLNLVRRTSSWTFIMSNLL